LNFLKITNKKSELFYDRGDHHQFTAITKDLSGPGELTEDKTFEFEFDEIEKAYESYNGTNVRLRFVTLIINSLSPPQKKTNGVTSFSQFNFDR
jgi:hypothetical protein